MHTHANTHTHAQNIPSKVFWAPSYNYKLRSFYKHLNLVYPFSGRIYVIRYLNVLLFHLLKSTYVTLVSSAEILALYMVTYCILSTFLNFNDFMDIENVIYKSV